MRRVRGESPELSKRDREAAESGAWLLTLGRDPSFYFRPDGSNELIETRNRMTEGQPRALAALWYAYLARRWDDYHADAKRFLAWLASPEGGNVYPEPHRSEMRERFEGCAAEYERKASRYRRDAERLGSAPLIGDDEPPEL